MSSYTKQMIAAAAEWLAVNTDPADPFLRIPGKGRQRSRIVDDDTDELIARYERKAAVLGAPPEIQVHVDELRSLTKKIREVEADSRDREDIIERILNRTFRPGHSKHSVDQVYQAYIGRWCLAWARHGYNVFDLSADFVAAMLLTDARELDISDVRLPFNGLLLITPPGFARGVEGGDYTKIHLSEIPRSHITEIDVYNEVSRVITEAREQDMSPTAIRELLAKIEEQAARKPPSLIKRQVDPDDAAIHIYATDGVHVLDTLIERKGLTWDSFEDLPDSVCCDEDKRCRQTLRQIVFGTLAYISAVEHAVEPLEVDRPRKGRRPGSEPAAKRWTVGRTIKLGPQLIKAAREGSREAALRLKHRFIVRGHYRNQAHGIRRSERTRRWIAPFWKGPEDGAALVHTYKLDDTKEQR